MFHNGIERSLSPSPKPRDSGLPQSPFVNPFSISRVYSRRVQQHSLLDSRLRRRLSQEQYTFVLRRRREGACASRILRLGVTRKRDIVSLQPRDQKRQCHTRQAKAFLFLCQRGVVYFTSSQRRDDSPCPPCHDRSLFVVPVRIPRESRSVTRLGRGSLSSELAVLGKPLTILLESDPSLNACKLRVMGLCTLWQPVLIHPFTRKTARSKRLEPVGATCFVFVPESFSLREGERGAHESRSVTRLNRESLEMYGVPVSERGCLFYIVTATG